MSQQINMFEPQTPEWTVLYTKYWSGWKDQNFIIDKSQPSLVSTRPPMTKTEAEEYAKFINESCMDTANDAKILKWDTLHPKIETEN